MIRRTGNYRPHKVTLDRREDGTLLYRSAYPLGPVDRRTGDWLHRWAEEAPDRVFLAERSGAGWRETTYAEALQKVQAIASSLLARGLGPDTPVMILSGNGVDHGLLALAGQYAGIPIVPVAEQYSLIHGAHGRLRHAVELIRPRMAYAVDAAQYGEALALDLFDGIEIVASRTHDRLGVTPFEALLAGAEADVDAAFKAVTPDSVVKILMTSGSTSAPKGVLTTHRMMCTNQAMIADSLPFLKERPPVIVDWLPWNHVFGGSHNFNMILANGGSLYIDDGKPMKGLFERTVENLSLVAGTVCFNVPVGFGMLLSALEADADLRRRFFADLDMIFYAGASLPQDIWEGFERMAMAERGEVPLMTSSWGLTETAPGAMIMQEPADRSGIVGVPMTGLTVKLVPDGPDRYEVRVKGDTITPGYFRNPEKTAEAFDNEGFFKTGDAMRFVDPEDPARGMRFDGRLSEEFKLSTGTWVRAAQLRLDMLACLAPLAADVVVTGANRDDVGLMIFPNMAAIEAQGYDTGSRDGVLNDPMLLGELRRRLTQRNQGITGSAERIARALVLAEPPSMAESEVTAKGNLNFNVVQARRADLLERLHAGGDPAIVTL